MGVGLGHTVEPASEQDTQTDIPQHCFTFYVMFLQCRARTNTPAA